MQTKRKAAANVFMEQNIMQQPAPAEALSADQEKEWAADRSNAPLPAQASAPFPPPMAMPAGPAAAKAPSVSSPAVFTGLKTSEELQLEKEPLRVRETGFWIFKRVIVPPNAYVVHTRLGRRDPVTIGLGISFHYNPNTDAYMIVPAAMQTIGIVANCISKEKQGINVLAYVQWQIKDFAVAYRKLDFSDSRDPLGIVNAQLREQAEAAIKDKIATMSVEEVLTDKEPVIEELTTRLKAVAEGRGAREEQTTNEGLGIKIVTVQIKEAFVSSQRLWENLQAPFRYEKEKTARISYLSAQDEIRERELQTRQLTETRNAETRVEIERITQSKETEALKTRLAEEQTRLSLEQQARQQTIQLEEQTQLRQQESEHRLQLEADRIAQEAALQMARLEAEASARRKALEVERALRELAEEIRLAEQQADAERQRVTRETELNALHFELRRLAQEQEEHLALQRLEAGLTRTRQEGVARLELEEAANRVKLALAEGQAEIDRRQQEIRNLINSGDLSSRLIERLPELAAQMPEIHDLTVLQTGDGAGAFDALAGFLAKVMTLAEVLGLPLQLKNSHAPSLEAQ